MTDRPEKNRKSGLLSHLWAKVSRVNHRHFGPDIVVLAFSLYASLFLRLEWRDFLHYVPVLNRHLFLFISVQLACFLAFDVYDIIWRYVSGRDGVKILKAVAASSVCLLATTYLVDIGRLPRAVFFIDFCLASLLVIGLRFARRVVYERTSGQAVINEGRRTLILGAGTNGRTLCHRFNTDVDAGYRVIGFVDDDPQKINRYVGGISVFGPLKNLPTILKELRAQEVVIALSRPSADLLRDTIVACRPFGIRPRLVAALAWNAREKKALDLLREVQLEDLLHRPRHRMDAGVIKAFVQGATVLVTGAGGSIGKEISRQIAELGPKRLLLLDHSELNLFEIDRELGSAAIPFLRDIKDKSGLRSVFEKHRPEIVIHAAAYKHVALVEANPAASVLNNVLGTRNLVELAEEYEVARFIQVSTDKAVNPAGVMGATKRVCELLVTEAGQRTGRLFCSVRFGNVLGSSGSLVPLLTNQIQSGGPVTITHVEMQRYFMLIPEAVFLVLKAAIIAEPGDIAVLEMGEPVRIVDIARHLIALLGKTEEECPIVFTQPGPGEKISEELYLRGDEIRTTDPDILVLPRGDSGDTMGERLSDQVAELVEAARRDSDLLKTLLYRLAQPHERARREDVPPIGNPRPQSVQGREPASQWIE